MLGTQEKGTWLKNELHRCKYSKSHCWKNNIFQGYGWFERFFFCHVITLDKCFMHHLWNFKLFGFSLTWKRRKNNSKVSVIFCTKFATNRTSKKKTLRHCWGSTVHSIFWGGFGLVQGSLNSEMCPCFHGVILVVLSETKGNPLRWIYIWKTFLRYLWITVLSQTKADSKKSFLHKLLCCLL